MIEGKEFIVAGQKFRVIPLQLMKALRLERKILQVVSPLLGGLNGVDVKSEANVSFFVGLAPTIADALSTLSDNEFAALSTDLLSSVMWLPEGKPPIMLETDQALNDAYMVLGSTMSVYKVMLEVMRQNKMLPFELAGLIGIGKGTEKIPTSTQAENPAAPTPQA